MADLNLDILIIPTYNVLSLGVADASTYPTNPPVVSSPTIEIDIPSIGIISVPFSVQDFNIFTSSNLEITELGAPLEDLPDGVYSFKYTVSPAYLNYVNKTFMRTEIIQQKYDEAFMKLDMMECDRAIKTQQKVDLSSIQFFIQGAISAANKCAIDEANKLYIKANTMLNNFIKTNCNCSGNNYITNFY